MFPRLRAEERGHRRCLFPGVFKFLSEAIFKWFDQYDKQLVIIHGDVILSKPPLQDLALPVPCNRDEKDTQMLLHATHAVNHSHHKILLKTVDTGVGVVVLVVSVAQGVVRSNWMNN